MKKLLLYLCLILLLVFGVMAYNYSNHVTTDGYLGTPPGPKQPAFLRIPSLSINAPILSVGSTPTGLMDAPTSQAVNSPYWSSVFWYAPGTEPGQAGNAVIAGHVDRIGGDPAIFWSLSSLKAGDSIYITTGNHTTLQFVVNRSVNYPANASNSSILQAVFGPATTHHLNLITCSGVWTGQGYDQRLVVFTTQVDA